MKKKSIFLGLITVLCFSASVAADTTWVSLGGPEGGAVEVNLLESSSGRMVIEFLMDGFYRDTVSIEEQPYTQVLVPGTTPFLERGFPDLGKVRESVIIPDRAHMSLRVLECDQAYETTLPLAPSKGNLTRDVDPHTVPFTFDPFYEGDGWFPADPAELGEPYIMRDYRGIPIQYNPIQYSPSAEKLRINTRVVVEVYTDGPGAVNVKDRRTRAGLYSVGFRPVYEKMFLNFGGDCGRYSPIPEPGKMVIVTHDDFRGTVHDFHQWKLQKGLDARLVDFSTIGTTAEDLKAYIQELYDTEGITYIVLVGDGDEIPTLRGTYESAHSDPCYVKLEGADHYPDAFISRISAQTSAHVNTQVSKFIEYERNPATGAAASWYTKGVGVASNESGGTSYRDWERADWLRDDLLAYTYTQVDPIYDPGASASDLTAALNEGRSILNYLGHGSGSSWSTTGFSVSHVEDLSNTWMLPFIVDVSCLNGSFVSRPTCFAEAWLRAGTWEEPTGAIAMFSASTSAAWVPPCVMQAEVVDLVAAEAATTIGGLFFGGSAGALDEYGGGGQGTQVMEQYNIFGDCSMVVRTDAPEVMSVQHDSTIFIGASSLSVVVPGVEGAMASLYAGGINFGAALTDVSGLATITIDPPLAAPMDVTLTVTALNKVPTITAISVIPPAGPFVIYEDHAVDDSAGDGDGSVDFGEAIDLDITLQNVGVDTALGATAALSSSDPYVTLVDDSHSYGDIPAGGELSSGWTYKFIVSPDCPDGHSIFFDLLVSDSGRETWESRFVIGVRAPDVGLESFDVDDSSGNGNGILDAGETVSIIVTVVNGGSEDASEAVGNLISADPYITILSGTSSFGTVPGPGSASNEANPFVVHAQESTPTSHMVDFTFDFSSQGGLYATASDFLLMVGHPEILILDLDGALASGPTMLSLLEEMGRAVDYATDFSVSFDGYRTIFVLLGIYTWYGREEEKGSGEGRSHALGESEALLLADFLDQGGSIYMEGGDTWAFDTQTSLHPYFHIDGLTDGAGDTDIIHGVAETFTEGMVFNYSGTNDYMDHLQAVEGAVDVFFNEAPSYTNGIAYDSGTYRTIGTSFEFGGLDDGAPPSTKADLMATMLSFFAGSSPSCDTDGDGYDGLSCGGDDCDDSNPSIHPGSPELCDGLDTDCDGFPEGDEVDADDDGYMICEGDCDDADGWINPGMTEGPSGEPTCSDGLDNDCDGEVDGDDPECEIPCTDLDGDGLAIEGVWCGPIDCDDSDPEVHPGHPEVQGNGIDDDCDGLVDEPCFVGVVL